MHRTAVSFLHADTPTLLQQLLLWGKDFNYFAILNSNQYHDKFCGEYDALIAVADEALHFDKSSNRFEQLKNYYNEGDWLFGYLSYDLKNDVERLSSSNPDYLDMPEIFFFRPAYLFEIKKNSLTIHSSKPNHEELYRTISSVETGGTNNFSLKSKLRQRTEKKKYIENVNHIREQIINGDYYELNYCQQFFCGNVNADAFSLYNRFNHISPSPFSAFVRVNDKYIISTSPERFLKKKGSTLISQPIKGTAKRNLADPIEDKRLADELLHSEKERAENLMIVDLVRNDLCRSAVEGSVKAEEICGIYSFPQVHQMISTVTSQLHPEVHPIDALKYAFPMGSMTGAPKIEVMHAIENYEDVKRGVYSGAIGYMDAAGDFDFNVVIRTIIYDTASHLLSYHAGSAITFDASAENEYNECLLKARAFRELIQDT